MIIIFASIVSLVLALLHFTVYKTLIAVFSVSVDWQYIIGIAFTILGLSFIAASILTFSLDNIFSRIIYTISATWLGIVVYLFLASCLYALVAMVIHLFAQDYSMNWFGYICFALAIGASIYGLIHARYISVKNIEISLPNLPAVWQNKSVVFVSDLHLGQVHGKSFATSVVTKINEINPDIVFIGGDLFDGVKVDENDIISPLAKLHPILGIYFITGNHDEFRDVTPYINAVKNVGIKVLNDEMVTIDGLQLIGVDDHDSSNPVKFAKILTDLKIDPTKPSLMLKHQPTLLDIAEKAHVSLQISGHTHRAQMFPLNIFTYLIYKGYDYGLNRLGNMQVYISSGVGTWGPPMRVGSDNEIVIIKFR